MTSFILGAVFATIGITLLNSFCELIINVIEWLKALISVKIVKCNAIIQEINDPPTSTRVIGFQVVGEEEENDE